MSKQPLDAMQSIYFTNIAWDIIIDKVTVFKIEVKTIKTNFLGPQKR